MLNRYLKPICFRNRLVVILHKHLKITIACKILNNNHIGQDMSKWASDITVKKARARPALIRDAGIWKHRGHWTYRPVNELITNPSLLWGRYWDQRVKGLYTKIHPEKTVSRWPELATQTKSDFILYRSVSEVISKWCWYWERVCCLHRFAFDNYDNKVR